MIEIFWYILKVLIVSGILTGYYYITLKDKVFHSWNRFYLLLTVGLSLLLPLVSLNIFGTDQGNIARALQTITLQDEIVIEMGQRSAPGSNLLILYGYILVSSFFISSLIKSLIKIRRIKNRYPQTKVEGVNFINTEEKGTPFSFFNSIFWNRSIDLHTTPGQQIFAHEVAHIKEKHTYDKIFISVVLLMFWINPFFWLIRKELNMIHEFIADKMALEDGHTGAFAEMILSSVFTRQQFSITNNFFYSPIKRRLIMLTKSNHAKANYISRLLVLPLAAIVFIGISCKVETDRYSKKPTDNTEAILPLETEWNLLTDSTPTMVVDNKKIVSLSVITPGGGKPAMAKVTYEDGSKEILTFKEAEAKGIVIPPPPPPPPPPMEKYNGKQVLYAFKTGSGDIVTVHYEGGAEENISVDQAKKANLSVQNRPEEEVTFTPPGSNKDKENKQQNLPEYDKVFTKVEQEASFPGGSAQWAKYIQKAIVAKIDDFGEEDFGTCVVKFLVDKNGNVSHVEATTMRGTHLAQTSVEAIQNGPKWIPAMQNDLPVNAYRLQPVTLTNPEK